MSQNHFKKNIILNKLIHVQILLWKQNKNREAKKDTDTTIRKQAENKLVTPLDSHNEFWWSNNWLLHWILNIEANRHSCRGIGD